MYRRVARGALGDLTMAAKYRFLHAADGSWLPDAAIFPALTLPSGSRSFDTGHASLFVPIWLEKDLGEWSIFGGGYDVNPGFGRETYALRGWAVTRNFDEHLNLGVEIYHQTPRSAGGPAQTNLGVDAIYQVTKQRAVMASGGPGREAVAVRCDSLPNKPSVHQLKVQQLGRNGQATWHPRSRTGPPGPPRSAGHHVISCQCPVHRNSMAETACANNSFLILFRGFLVPAGRVELPTY
jgi:hypothetical protein